MNVENSMKSKMGYHNGYRADSVDSFYRNNLAYLSFIKRVSNWDLVDCVIFSICFCFQIEYVVVDMAVDVLRGSVLDFYLIVGGC